MSPSVSVQVRLMFFAGALALAACSTGEADANLSEILATEGDKPASDAKALPDDEEDPTADAGSVTESPDSDPPPDDEEESPGTPSAPVTKTCSSAIAGHTSETTITYTKTKGTIEITKISALVTNAYGGNKNDLDLYVKTLSSTQYKAVLASGDILESGVDVPVPFPKNLSFEEGDTLRVDTYFDEPLVIDPYDSCFVQL